MKKPSRFYAFFLSVKCLMGRHKWTEWWYVSERSCEQFRECFHCNTKETRLGPHDFGEWEYLEPNRCQQFRVCRRCEAREGRGNHVFRGSDFCIRCREWIQFG